MSKSTKNNSSSQASASAQKLVSVICRTVGRPELKQALASVSSQTHANIEVLLVDAVGDGIKNVDSLCPPLQLKLVCHGNKLTRPQAANAGLAAATGDYLLFLDDDDWIAESHLENLLALLESNEGLARAAYSGTHKTDASGKLLDGIFNLPYSSIALRHDNFIPIHSMLFASSLLKEGCAFDETLDIYEDWDFWLQVSELTAVLHDDRITAFYRQGGDSETAVENLRQKYETGHPNALAREKVLAKRLPNWTAADVNQILGSMDKSEQIAERDKKLTLSHLENLRKERSLKEKDKRILLLISERDSYENKLANLAASHRLLKADHKRLAFQHEELAFQHEELDKGVKEVLNSFSWRITRPYRFLITRLSKYVWSPLFKSLKKRSVEAILKNPDLHKKIYDTRNKLSVNSSGKAADKKFHFVIDSPSTENNLFRKSILIEGWALNEEQEITIDVKIDDLELQSFKPSLSRPDVAQFFSTVPHSACSGFSQKVDLQFDRGGAHILYLTLTTPGGDHFEIEQEFLLYENRQLYNSWLQSRRRGAAASITSNEEPTAPIVHIFVEGSDDIELSLQTLNSIAAQHCKHWQIHYQGPHWSQIKQAVEDFSDQCRLIEHRGQLLEKCNLQTDFLIALNSGERLFPHALQDLLNCANSKAFNIVYSDHDTLHLDEQDDNQGEEHRDPIFTFAWSPEHLLSSNYVADVYLARLSKIPQEFFRQYDGPNWRYGLLLEAALESEPNKISRVPDVLWSISSQAGTADKLAAELAELESYLERNNLAGRVVVDGKTRYIDWELNEEPLVSIIIPTMGKLELIEPCLGSLVAKTKYSNYEIIMLDNSRGKNPDGIRYLNEKGFRVIECDQAFNWSRLNNIGASHASGEYFLFLNDDVEVTDGDWLNALVKQAVRADIGTVGALLLYPNGAIQHAGVLLVNHGGGAAHLFHKMRPDKNIYLRLDKTVREVSASTGACLMVSKAKFDAINGFDEKLAVVGNDVDFCLRLLEQGYRNIWTPQCCLIHHESISRKASAPKEDEDALRARWGKLFQAGDTYYNPNLSLNQWDCSIRKDDLLVEYLDSASSDIDSAGPSPQLILKEGVNLIGYARAEMGLGEAVRSDARALEAAAESFAIINFEVGNPSRMTDLSWQHKESIAAPYDINLIHINPDHLQLVMEELPLHFFAKRYNIGYWAWELEEIPDDWAASFAEVDEVWVPSDFVKAAVEKISPVPVVTIPHCVALGATAKFGREHFALPNDKFIFLAMFDTHSIAERKNPYAAIEAFNQAFKADDNRVCLVLKVNNSNPDNRSDLAASIESYPNILLIDGVSSREEIDSLFSLSNCFISLHRSEGFGLGPAEAMCLGKPVILTNWSGSTDYMTADNCIPIDYELIEIKEDLGPYKAGQRWADPDIKQAAAAMQKLLAVDGLAEEIGAKAKATIETSFSPLAVGARAAARLKSIRKLLQEL